RRPDGGLARPPAAEDRVDRRPHLALGDDARLRAERRPRPGAVHRLDHRLWPRRRGVHDDRPRARPTDLRRRRAPGGGGCDRRGLRSRARRAREAGGAMKRLLAAVALSLTLCAAAGAGAQRNVDLLRVLGPQFAGIERISTVPILLPRALPLLGNYTVYATGSGTRHSWDLE